MTAVTVLIRIQSLKNLVSEFVSLDIGRHTCSKSWVLLVSVSSTYLCPCPRWSIKNRIEEISTWRNIICLLFNQLIKTKVWFDPSWALESFESGPFFILLFLKQDLKVEIPQWLVRSCEAIMTLVINHKTNKMSDQESSEFSWSQAGNSSSKIIRDLKYGSWNKYTFPIFHRKSYHWNYTLKTLLWKAEESSGTTVL